MSDRIAKLRDQEKTALERITELAEARKPLALVAVEVGDAKSKDALAKHNTQISDAEQELADIRSAIDHATTAEAAAARQAAEEEADRKLADAKKIVGRMAGAFGEIDNLLNAIGDIIDVLEQDRTELVRTGAVTNSAALNRLFAPETFQRAALSAHIDREFGIPRTIGHPTTLAGTAVGILANAIRRPAAVPAAA